MTSEIELRKIVLLGNVDHGKSTLAGRLILDTDKTLNIHDIEKLKLEAKKNKKSTWWLAYLLDEDIEERAKGKTHSYIIKTIKYKDENIELIDVPGHKSLVTEMIQGSSYANIALLVVSIRKGELESGLQGQTLEHIVIARGMGIKNIIVAINKMDTIDWNMDELDKSLNIIKKKIDKLGFQSVKYIPISAYLGENISSIKNENINLQNISLLDTIITTKPSIKLIENINLQGKPLLKTQLMFYNIKDTNIITAGLDIKLHTSKEIYDAQIIKIFNGKFPFVAKSNYKGGFVKAIIKLTEQYFPEEIYPNIILRNGDKTIGIGKVLPTKT